MLNGRRQALAALTAALCVAAGCGQAAPRASRGRAAEKEEPAAIGQPVERGEFVEQHWPDGTLRLRKQVLKNPDGTLVNHGTYTRWYDNGRKEYEASFVRGQKHGTATMWHRNGQEWRQEQYANGYRHGVSRTWDENGTLRKEERHVNGKPHGTWTTWSKNGKIKWQGSFDRGTPKS